MKSQNFGRVLRFAAILLPLGAAARPALGQSQRAATAHAFGVSVSTALVNQKSPSATAPAEGGMVQTDADDVTITALVSARDAYALASGWSDDGYSDAVSSASLGQVNVLNGLITANAVLAMATTTGEGSDGFGSSFANLVVKGVSLSDPGVNTRVDLPGVGYVVLNEQITTGSGITVNMIHVYLQQTGLLGTRPAGEIIVGSASSSVN
mgnify:CR=1 FL=1|jgi:hypothetical protein